MRESLRIELEAGPRTLRELSGGIGTSEKEVREHLAHLARSLGRRGERLRADPARCLACGFVFRDRARYTKPSRCPRCRGTHLAPPRYWID